MTPLEDVLVSLLGVLFAGNIYWIRRLITSNDAFRLFVRSKLEEYGIALATIEERHRQEDSAVLGRRAYDHGRVS